MIIKEIELQAGQGIGKSLLALPVTIDFQSVIQFSA